MTQLEYDITSFILKNKEGIKKFLDLEALNYIFAFEIFKDFPQIFEESDLNLKVNLLIYYLIPIFNSNYEQISEIITGDFYIKYLL